MMDINPNSNGHMREIKREEKNINIISYMILVIVYPNWRVKLI